ncbi:MAG: acyl-CoA dehydrogenase [Myxococcota bacterium]|nr:acyl-CoA dehydrogenase [Myxococcota bacterium]
MSLEHSLISQDEFDFLLFDWLKIDSLFDTEFFSHLDRTSVVAALQSARSIATEYFLPYAAEADEQEPHIKDGKVVLPAHMKPAIAAMREGGWFAAARPFSDNGAQLPYSVIQSAYGLIYGANLGTAGYALLTMAAANLLAEWGSEDLKSAYLPQMLEGTYLGTMCLSEPDSGSSLANIKTKATERPDGTFAVQGTKMWITGGEHELSENIVHLVLAKLPDAPAGVKGISLFLVPRYRKESGEDNNIKLVGLNHKMGYRGTINTVIEFGDEGESIGYLVGGKHDGLRAMFHMMNEARIGVGYSAAVLAYAGFRVSYQYATERKQGNHPGSHSDAEIPIVEHADVRRMLWTQRAFADGALALTLYASYLCDKIRVSEQGEAEELEQLLGFLTPLCKAWASEVGLEANYWAIQVLGGAGYTRDFPVERYYRDNRLNPIHEGTNSIQALDLLGRKTLRDQGRSFGIATRWLHSLWEGAAPENKDLVDKLKDGWAQIGNAAQRAGTIALTGNLKASLSGATFYLEAVGSVVAGSLLLDQAKAGGDERRKVAAYFIEALMPINLARLDVNECASSYWLAGPPHST